MLGLEYTATPKSTNKNIIYHYGLEDGAGKFLKIPVVMGRTNTAGYSDDDIEEMKLKDGIKLHERRKSIVYKYCIVRFIRLNVITYDDLSDFSDEIQLEVKRILYVR